MTARFYGNEAGQAAFLASREVGTYLDRLGKRVARTTRTETPLGRTHDAWKSIGSTGPTMTVAGPEVTVYSTDPFWHLIEFGSVNNPAYAPMRRAVARHGLNFRDGRS